MQRLLPVSAARRPHAGYREAAVGYSGRGGPEWLLQGVLLRINSRREGCCADPPLQRKAMPPVQQGCRHVSSRSVTD